MGPPRNSTQLNWEMSGFRPKTLFEHPSKRLLLLLLLLIPVAARSRWLSIALPLSSGDTLNNVRRGTDCRIVACGFFPPPIDLGPGLQSVTYSVL